MNGTTSRALVAIAVLAVLCLGAAGCVFSARGHVEGPVLYVDDGHRRTTHTYHYFPDVNVYFDPGASCYYWRDGGIWRRDLRPPRGIVLVPERRRIFRSDAVRPYEMHDRVVQRFRTEERRGDATERRGEATERRGERIQQRGENTQERGAAVERRGEDVGGRRGEAIERRGEAIQERGERREERGEDVERRGEDRQR